jgi:hypothetical protein
MTPSRFDAKKYEEAGNPLPATAHDIAIWAIEQGLLEPQRSTVDRCAEEIARAVPEGHITDPQGRHNVREGLLQMSDI